VLSYVRRGDGRHAVVAMNLTPVPRERYRVGAPVAGRYTVRLSTDEARFGGSGYGGPLTVTTEAAPFHGFEQSMVLALPPLGAVVLLPDDAPAAPPPGSEAAAPAGRDG
jgi:1,4-alpha-glucan branching enzyme